jgi:hypothetical protein
MSLYKCKLVPLDKLPVGPIGVVSPLCNDCETRDCTNPIEPVKVTVFGRQLDWRIYKKSHISSVVVQCAGYSKDNANVPLPDSE